MFHVKRHTLKLVLLLCAFLINSTAYPKNKINPNLDSELVTQDRIIEDIDLDITLYFIEGNKEIDTPTKTIIKEYYFLVFLVFFNEKYLSNKLILSSEV